MRTSQLLHHVVNHIPALHIIGVDYSAAEASACFKSALKAFLKTFLSFHDTIIINIVLLLLLLSFYYFFLIHSYDFCCFKICLGLSMGVNGPDKFIPCQGLEGEVIIFILITLQCSLMFVSKEILFVLSHTFQVSISVSE